MDSIDALVVSYLDLEIRKREFKEELASLMRILPSDIRDIWLESTYDGVVHQKLIVDVDEKLTFEDFKNVDFDYVDEKGNIVFEVGDLML